MCVVGFLGLTTMTNSSDLWKETKVLAVQISSLLGRTSPVTLNAKSRLIKHIMTKRQATIGFCFYLLVLTKMKCLSLCILVDVSVHQY